MFLQVTTNDPATKSRFRLGNPKEPETYLVDRLDFLQSTTVIIPVALLLAKASARNGDLLQPSLTVNNKTIFFIVIDLFEYKRGPMKSVDITELELVQRVEMKADLPGVGEGDPVQP